ncbi:acetate/propionate family kinase [Ktedonobacter robiniae]|uniref:Acetate kinase n=1 Tax=Ktedonobacter robiniae TaxID=2778365 RepID=A0ABQ3UNE2_9CHLR|nr:acetate kinase [Ktedonobacter robiniae]GHO54266.1 acetate kinase [Ktedonobacter robiniae]
MKILVMNAGSSSQKSCLYEVDSALPHEAPRPLWQAHADWTKEKGQVELKVKTSTGKEHTSKLKPGSHGQVVKQLLQTLWQGEARVINSPAEITLVGHRVVHGGPHYQKSVWITREVKQTIDRLKSFAPLHNPANLEGIQAIEELMGDVPQIACFDTAFHSSLPPHSAIYPLPYDLYEQGIRRYGFHGISHQYCSRRASEVLQRDAQSLRLVSCHLGNGCSLAAIQDGKSIETTMGFTPLEGLMMGTRSGTIDASILFYLQREHGYDTDHLETLLNKQSGLRGISGISGDVRQVMEEAQHNERAQLAMDIYVYRLRYFIGAMVAVLGGLDALLFTGGVGENSAEIRARACAGFPYLHLKLDQQKNNASPVDTDIASFDSAVRVLVVHTEEDWEIARDCWHLAQQEPAHLAQTHSVQARHHND